METRRRRHKVVDEVPLLLRSWGEGGIAVALEMRILQNRVDARRKWWGREMKIARYAGVVLGLGLVMMPWSARSQATTGQEEAPQAMPAEVPQDQRASKQEIEKLFEVMRLRLQMQNMAKMMPTLVQQQLQQQLRQMGSQMPNGAPTPEQSEEIRKAFSKYMEKAMSLYPVDEMLSDLEGLYQRYLSRSDIEAYTTFYESPAGQHLLNLQPAIMHEYTPMLMRRVQERTKPMADDLLKEIQRIANSPSGATQSKPAPANKTQTKPAPATK